MKKVVKFVLIGFGALVLIGMIGAAFSDKKVRASSPKTDSITNTAEKPASVWEYSEDVDKMTSKKTYYAVCNSTNKIEFHYPYAGGSIFSLTVRNTGGKNEVVLSVSKGQFMANFDGQKSVKVKFDDRSPLSVNYTGTSDGSSNVIFLSSVPVLLSQMMSSKKLMIEAEFYQQGRKVIEFDIQGLEWKRR